MRKTSFMYISGFT